MSAVIKARPTLYRGIQMRSRLEADYAASLDHEGIWAWDYEPTCFAGPSGQWLPDFRRRLDPPPGDGTWESDRWEYVEVKPAPATLAAALDMGTLNPMLAKLAVAWYSEPDARLFLAFWEYGGAVPVVEFRGSHKSRAVVPQARLMRGPNVWTVSVQGSDSLIWPTVFYPKHQEDGGS